MSHYDTLALKYEEYYYDAFNDGYPGRFEAIGDIVKRACRVRPKVLLDLCGATGALVPFLKKHLELEDVIVGDYSQGMLELARKNGYKAVQCDLNDVSSIQALPEMIGRKLDAVFVMWSIHHSTDIAATVTNLARHALKDTGVIIIVAERRNKFPGPRRLWDIQDEIFRNNILDLDKISEEGYLSMYKEWFSLPPFRVASQKYIEMINGHFLSWIHTATEAEMGQLNKDLRAKDVVELPNEDFVYVFQKVQ